MAISVYCAPVVGHLYYVASANYTSTTNKNSEFDRYCRATTKKNDLQNVASQPFTFSRLPLIGAGERHGRYVIYWQKNPCFSTENAQKMEYGEDTECFYLSSVMSNVQHTAENKYRTSALPSVRKVWANFDQKCSVLFLYFFFSLCSYSTKQQVMP